MPFKTPPKSYNCTCTLQTKSLRSFFLPKNLRSFFIHVNNLLVNCQVIDVRSFFNLKGKHAFFLEKIPSYSLDEQSRFYTISYKHYEVKTLLAPKI